MKKKLTGTGGPALVSAYNVMTQVLSSVLWSHCVYGGIASQFFGVDSSH